MIEKGPSKIQVRRPSTNGSISGITRDNFPYLIQYSYVLIQI